MRIPNNKRLILSLKLLIVALITVNGSCAIVYILQCRPMTALWATHLRNTVLHVPDLNRWDPFIPAHCWSAHVYLVWGYFQGGDISNSRILSERIIRTDIKTKSILHSYGSHMYRTTYLRLMEGADFYKEKACYLGLDERWSHVRISCILSWVGCWFTLCNHRATACSFVRTILFGVVLDETDPTWSIGILECWAMYVYSKDRLFSQSRSDCLRFSSLEENLGLIAVNLPVMFPLYRLVGEKFSTRYSSAKLYIRQQRYASNRINLSNFEEDARQGDFYRMHDLNGQNSDAIQSAWNLQRGWSHYINILGMRHERNIRVFENLGTN